MFKNVYSFYPAFCTQPAFYSQSAVCILPLVRSLQSAVRSMRFTLTEYFSVHYCISGKHSDPSCSSQGDFTQ